MALAIRSANAAAGSCSAIQCAGLKDISEALGTSSATDLWHYGGVAVPGGENGSRAMPSVVAFTELASVMSTLDRSIAWSVSCLVKAKAEASKKVREDKKWPVWPLKPRGL